MKTLKALSIFLPMIAGIAVLIGSYVVWLENPELTKMQWFFKTWYYNLIATALFFLTVITYNLTEKK